MDKAQLARNLKNARSAKGLSQAAAAAAVGKSRQTIVNWESPTSTPEPDERELGVLASLYGVSTQALRYSQVTRGPAVHDFDVTPPLAVHERLANARDASLDAEVALPRQLEIMALEFEKEALRAGADAPFMRYARSHMRDPHLLAMFLGGYDAKPMSDDQQRAEFESVIEELRSLLKRRIQRLGLTP